MPDSTVSPDSSAAPAVSPAAAQRLLELCIEIGTPRDIADVLAVILDATTDLLDCGRASMLLYDTSARQLRFVAATSEETATLAQIPVPLHGSLAGTIFRENRPVVAADVQRDTRHFAEPAEQAGYRPRAIAGAPMRVDGQPVGVLEALDPHDGAFSESDIEVLMAVAAQAAVAVHAARQRHALERAHTRLAHLNRLTGRMLALTSDEFNAPLATIRTAAEALRGPHGDDVDGAAADILGALARVEALVRPVAEAGSLPEPGTVLETEPVVLQGLLREASHEAHPAVRLVLDLPADSIIVSAHPRRLRLALVHVVAEAARAAAAHDADGEVTVRAGVSGSDAVVDIRDSTIAAPGDSPDDGLDLVVARVLIERDGGSVHAVGGGVQVRLPRAVGPAAV
ncbi:MAG TPA: GAF domain-containing protein [Rubricoccaceae bacterium]